MSETSHALSSRPEMLETSHAFRSRPEMSETSHAFSSRPEMSETSHAFSSRPEMSETSHAFRSRSEMSGASHAFSSGPEMSGTGHMLQQWRRRAGMRVDVSSWVEESEASHTPAASASIKWESISGCLLVRGLLATEISFNPQASASQHPCNSARPLPWLARCRSSW